MARAAGRRPTPAPSISLAAEADAVLAIASGGPPLRDEVIVEGNTDAYTAQVYGLYVTPTRYGGGIGRRILGELATRFAHQGHQNLCLWAFELNPFRRFYDRLGGQSVAQAEWRMADTIDHRNRLWLARDRRSDLGLLVRREN